MTDKKGVLKATAAVRTMGMDYALRGNVLSYPETPAPLTRDEAFSKIAKGGKNGHKRSKRSAR